MDICAPAKSHKSFIRSLRRAMLVIALSPAAFTAATPIQHGLSGFWYQPRTTGEGVVLEVYENAVAPGVAHLQGIWLTFYRPSYWDDGHESGPSAQRWYTFGGEATENATGVTFALHENSGGNFIAPPATTAMQVGTVTLSFSDCANARLDYALDDQSGISGDPTSGTIRLTRLTPNVACTDSGSRLLSAEFAHSGHWHDAALAGQGVFFELNPNAGLLLLAWPTYAPVGEVGSVSRLRWFTGQGHYLPGSQTIPLTLYQTTGGLRDGGAA